MATSNGYTVPSQRFVVDEGRNENGRWTATVTYRIKDGRKWRDVVSVILRECPRGTIELDAGSREAGGRARTGTHDKQEAVNEAAAQVERMGKAVMQNERIERTIYAGEGEITMLGSFKVWLDAKLDERKQDPAEGITDATIRHVEQAVEIAVNMKERDFRVAELIGTMDDFSAALLKYRRGGFSFDPNLVEK